MIVIDCEFSGLDFREHSLLSIGAIDFDNPTNTFYGECRLGGGATFDPVALQINGFSEDDITSNKKQTP